MTDPEVPTNIFWSSILREKMHIFKVFWSSYKRMVLKQLPLYVTSELIGSQIAQCVPKLLTFINLAASGLNSGVLQY